jgi:hypothetical protein
MQDSFSGKISEEKITVLAGMALHCFMDGSLRACLIQAPILRRGP